MPDDLIKRLEEAREPSRELDLSVAKAIGKVPDATVSGGVTGFMYMSRGQPACVSVPAYTSSVDAALSLVPEGWKCGFENNNLYDDQPDHSEAWLWPSDSNFEPDWQLGYDCMRAASPDTHGHAATPALAICIASLRARPEAGEGVE